MNQDFLFDPETYRGLRKPLPGRFAASEFAPHAFANWVIDQVVDG
ncbi:MAG: hypothetical protein ACO3DT_02920 [Gammaproteobacteria bacterium]